MNRHLWRATALILAIGLHSQAARAEEHSIWSFLFGNQDPRLTATGIAVGVGADVGSYALYHKHGSPPTRIASPGMAYAITAYGCAVVYPILATIVVQRPLTPREAYVGFANCVVPIIGGWIVDASLPHTAWNDGLPDVVPHHRHHHYHYHQK